MSVKVHYDIENCATSALSDQYFLMEAIGACVGEELRKLMPTGKKMSSCISVFSCPLDEALVECTIGTSPSSETVFEYEIAPYGSFPKSTGRTRIGQMDTQPLELFWRSICYSMNLSTFKLRKLRGHNGHHIVESSFKAFCRAVRCYIDDSYSMWDTQSASFSQGLSLQREASINRCTKETSINVSLKMDGAKSGISVNTRIPFLDEFFTTLVSECPSMSLSVECTGDIWVDDHHTTEDVSIAIGQAIHRAVGSKAGLNRMWTSEARQGGTWDMQRCPLTFTNPNSYSSFSFLKFLDKPFSFKDAHVKVVMDLSNRPCLFHDLDLFSCENEMLDSVTSIEMIPHALESLVMNGHMTVHIIQLSTSSRNIWDLIIATARAYGRALYHCTAVDPRRCGATASSKGTLSM